jgi:hypothetical protein
MPGVIYPQAMRRIIHAQLGHERETSAAVDRMFAIDAAYGYRIVADLEKRKVHLGIIRACVDGLR